MKSQINDNVIKVCYITDENYCMYAMTSLYSLILNKMKSTYVYAYIIADNISKDNKKKFMSLSAEDININIIDYDNKFVKKIFAKTKYVSSATFIRMNIPNILKEDRILYLDCDTLILNDLCDFYNVDLNGMSIGCIEDIGQNILVENIQDYFNKYGFDNYFNAGVLLMDLKKLRSIHFSDLAYQQYLYSNFFKYEDQDIFNFLLNKSKKILDFRYNSQLSIVHAMNKWRNGEKNVMNVINAHYGTDFNALKDIFEETIIFHYCGKKEYISDCPLLKDVINKYHNMTLQKVNNNII